MRVALCLAVVVTLGCPSVDKDPAITESAATIARFAPDSANRCASVLPFPSDLSKDPTSGLLNLPVCPTDSPSTIDAIRGLNTLDGYSINISMTAPFSAPVDTTTLDDAIIVLNADTMEHHPVTSLFDAAGSLVAIQPLEPFVEATRYIVGISSELKDANGNEIASDQAFTLLKSDTPLVDEDGYSVIGLDDASAFGLEQLRLAWQPIFAAMRANGVFKSDVLVAWSFTTQTVTTSYPGLAALAGGPATVTHDNVIPAVEHPLLPSAGIPFNNLCGMHTGRITLKNLIGPGGTFVAGADGLPVVDEVVASYVLITPNLDTPWDGTGSPPADFCTTPWDFQNVAIFAHTLSRCKNLALATANLFAQPNPFVPVGPDQRWAVLAVDGPRAGGRTISPLGDQDLDTCPDQGETPELIALAGESPNPFGIRDRMRQWGLELAQIAATVKIDVRPFVGADTTGEAPLVDVGMLGHSWGGMAAILAGAVSPHIDVLAVTAASGEYGAIFEPAVAASVAADLAAAGMTPSSPGYQAMLTRGVQETLAIFRWGTEPADPLYLTALYPRPDVLPVFVQVVAAGGGAADADLHESSTQMQLADAFEFAGHDFDGRNTFALECIDGDTTQPICEDSLGAVGAPLQPCAPDAEITAGGDLALAKTSAMQIQLVTFITSLGTQIFGEDSNEDCAP